MNPSFWQANGDLFYSAAAELNTTRQIATKDGAELQVECEEFKVSSSFGPMALGFIQSDNSENPRKLREFFREFAENPPLINVGKVESAVCAGNSTTFAARCRTTVTKDVSK